jgi:hypothetical protein
VVLLPVRSKKILTTTMKAIPNILSFLLLSFGTSNIHCFTIQHEQRQQQRQYQQPQRLLLSLSSGIPPQVVVSSSLILHAEAECNKRRTYFDTTNTNNYNNNKKNNKLWIQQLAFIASITTTVVCSSLPYNANAGLLDDYGTDFKSTTKKVDPSQVVITSGDKSSTSTNNAEINPTLRGCKY